MFANRRAEFSVLFLLVILSACSKPAQPTELPADAVTITQTLTKLPGGPSWNIETVGGGAVAGERTRWGVDGVVDGVPYPAEYGRPRPDVATTFGVPSYANSGYVLELLGQRFVPRAHTLFIRVLTHDSKGTLGGGLNPELETVAKGTGYHFDPTRILRQGIN
jgi:hypothetical protein